MESLVFTNHFFKPIRFNYQLIIIFYFLVNNFRIFFDKISELIELIFHN